jgi:hypothetical protein
VGLTSPVLPYLLAVLSGGILAGIVVAWPRLARFGAWQVAVRMASLCLLQAFVLLLIFVIINRSGVFYSSWTELFGSARGGASVVAARGGTGSTEQPLVVTGRVDVRVRGNFAAGGTLQSVRLHGQLSGLTATGHVYLPVGYQAHSAQRYPTLLVISDAATGSASPYAASRLVQSAAIEIAAHRLPPLIMVMLPATVAPGDQACLDLPPRTGPAKQAARAIQGQTFFAQDVPAVLPAYYAVSSQPSDWALLGDQSGGYCALQLTLNNSYVFSTAVAPRADYSAPPGVPGALLSSQFRQQYNLVWQLSHLPMQPVTVQFVGQGRDTGPGPVQPFLSLARRPMQVSMIQLGTSNYPLGNVLDWIGAAVTSHVHPG